MQFDLMLRIHLDDDDEGMSRLIIEQLRTNMKAMHTCGDDACCVHVISSDRTRNPPATHLTTTHSINCMTYNLQVSVTLQNGVGMCSNGVTLFFLCSGFHYFGES